MAEFDLTPHELETLASFLEPTVPEHVDPLAFAKLLSLSLVNQREGGPVVTESGMALLESAGRDAK